jgi:hypothetical protein
LLIVTLFHAASNTAGMFLPIAPTVTGDVRPFAIAALIQVVLAVAVTLLAGPARLSAMAPAHTRTEP